MTVDESSERWAYETKSPFRSSEEQSSISISGLTERARWGDAAEQVAFQIAGPRHWEYPRGAQREAEMFAGELGDPESERSGEEHRWGAEDLEQRELKGWSETEPWEAEEPAEPKLYIGGEAEWWNAGEFEEPEFEALGEEERLEPESAGWSAAERRDSDDFEGETEASHGPQVGLSEDEGADLLGELFAAGFADNLDEAEGVASTATVSDEVFESEVQLEEFIGSEHKAIGDGGSGKALSSIAYGSPAKLLTFGEVVALAGDYFATYDEMVKLARTPGGPMEIAWARWHCLDLKKQVPEPRADDAQKDAVRERYFKLASKNVSHFSTGGTAWQAYTFWHSKAIVDALEAGQQSDKAAWRRALTKEAFGDHFLTDMFSAGHVRMPRAAIRDWYGRQMPGPERLLSYMANFMYDRLDERQQLQRRARFFEWIAGSVTEAMVTRIKTIGGEAVNTFSLGDIVGLALHNFDNTGLQVVSEVDANGRNIPGGHRWRAVGDSHLGTRGHDATRASISGCRDDGRDHDRVDGSQTRTMATAAVRASLADLERVRRVGAEIGSRPVSTAQKATAVKQALGGPIFAAKGFIPREDRTPSANVAMEADAGRAPLEWRWGQLGDVAYCAVDKTVKGQIAAELRVLACEVQDPVEGSLGVKIYGTRNAYRSFVQHLSADGIKAIETAVGKPAR